MSFMDSAILKNRLVNAGVLLVSLFIAAKVYQAQVNMMNGLKRQQEEEQHKNNLLENIKGVEKNLWAYAGVLRERDEGAVMNTINTLAEEPGLIIESMRPGPQQRYQQYTKIPYFLEVRAGNYHAIGHFLAKVESSQSFFIVEKLTIQQPDSMNKELLAQVTLSTVSLNQAQ